MELDDEKVLAAIQQHAPGGPVAPEDLVADPTTNALIFRATNLAFEPPEALAVVERSFRRLEADGYLERRGAEGSMAVTRAGLEHLKMGGVTPDMI